MFLLILNVLLKPAHIHSASWQKARAKIICDQTFENVELPCPQGIVLFVRAFLSEKQTALSL